MSAPSLPAANSRNRWRRSGTGSAIASINSRWDSVMHSTSRESSRSSWVSGRLVWPFRSMPTFLRAETELALAGIPSRFSTPAETTFRERSGSGCAARACWRRAAPIGLRQMFPVQTTRMCPVWGIGLEKGHGTPQKAKPYRAPALGARSDPLQGAQAPVELDRPLEQGVDQGSRGIGLVRRAVGRLAVWNMLLLEVRLVDPRLVG